jgi:transcriptional regulator with XRE-family HTH domain
MDRPKSPLTLARERKGLNQSDIAEELDVTQATVSHWETGAATPHPSQWKDIASVYEISMSKLFDFFGEAKAS